MENGEIKENSPISSLVTLLAELIAGNDDSLAEQLELYFSNSDISQINHLNEFVLLEHALVGIDEFLFDIDSMPDDFRDLFFKISTLVLDPDASGTFNAIVKAKVSILLYAYAKVVKVNMEKLTLEEFKSAIKSAFKKSVITQVSMEMGMYNEWPQNLLVQLTNEEKEFADDKKVQLNQFRERLVRAQFVPPEQVDELVWTIEMNEFVERVLLKHFDPQILDDLLFQKLVRNKIFTPDHPKT